ncbi:membrane protein [Caballeronia calidae]|uniref:UPF0114 protein AWB78_03657 n=2 Tax=Caballeronia calidae TaxID=1777139 RepID=A0A158C9U1_9BURK|nr:membrane protein [Caballeronia calidae]
MRLHAPRPAHRTFGSSYSSVIISGPTAPTQKPPMSAPKHASTSPSQPGTMKALPKIIFMSRWLQVPLYLGLIVAQAVYVVLFLKEVWHLVSHAMTLDEINIMLVVLGLIDVVMISNLLIMVIVGGYETFVSRLGVEGHPDEPEWLDHVNAGVLKVKLSMALISISSIHLLKTFINPDQHTFHTVLWQVIIHVAFLLSALIMAYVDRLTTHTHPRHFHDESFSPPRNAIE